MRGFDFDCAIAPGGYAWWYVDAFSDEGSHALTVIAFVGSVFSPWYAAARRRPDADPLHFCAVNLVLSGADRRWTMTERGRGALQRSASHLRIGPSGLECDATGLTVHVDEVAVPWPRRVRGSIRIEPILQTDQEFTLDPAGEHLWRPLWPQARACVELSHPAQRWSGDAYVDSNLGRVPLEQSIAAWNWCRTQTRDAAGRPTARVVYDVDLRDGGHRELALQFDQQGGRPIDMPAQHRLPPTGWRLPRATRSTATTPPQVVRTLIDGPFYARSELAIADAAGASSRAMHETLSLQRFGRRWVQALLPFRMARRADWARSRRR